MSRVALISGRQIVVWHFPSLIEEMSGDHNQFLARALAEAEGKSIDFPANPVNKIMVRVQGALIFDDGESGVPE